MKKLALTLAFSVISASASFAATYKEQAVNGGGSITGAVQFTGQLPALKKEIIGKDNAVCGEGDVVPNPVTVSGSGALKNVVVFLEKVESGKPWPTDEFKVNQLKCAFDPYLQVIRKKGNLTIKNSDPVLHNVHPYEHIGTARRTLFNMAQPNQGQVSTKKIKTRRGQIVELACDAHSWMSGWIYVLDHPYFAVVGADGNFKIDDIPPGKYKLKAWHPVLQFQEQEIEIKADGTSTANFSFTAQKQG